MIQIGSLINTAAPEEFKHQLQLTAPTSGQVVAWNELPDLSLKAGIWGEGLAIQSRATHIASPVEGVIEKLDINAQRWLIKAKSGLRLMLQIGPVAKPLLGERLGVEKRQGDKVSKGEIISYFDPLFLQQQWGYCFCIMTVMNRKGVKAIVPEKEGARISQENLALRIYL